MTDRSLKAKSADAPRLGDHEALMREAEKVLIVAAAEHHSAVQHRVLRDLGHRLLAALHAEREAPEGPWLIEEFGGEEQPGWRIFGLNHGDELRMSRHSFTEAEALAVRDALNRVARVTP